jgi:hypothetical protein
MNGLTLKIIAMVTMLIDHVTAVLIPENTLAYMIGRSIGRLAFPIFCFLLVEGLLHTKDIRKYLLSLGIFALISEVPFDLAFSQSFAPSSSQYHQNVFFTLFIGLLVIYILKLIDEYPLKINQILGSILKMLVIILGCLAAMMLYTDYSYLGILIIATFYLLRKNKITLSIVLFLIIGFQGLEAIAIFSMIFISFYNGERGPKINKYIFYAFYPVHIFVIYLISRLPMF